MGFQWLYAVFWRDTQTLKPMWAMTTSKMRAIKHSRRHPGSDVYRVGYGSSNVWDAPTFKAVGDKIHTTPTHVYSMMED